MRRAIRVGLAMVLSFAGATVLGVSGAEAQTTTPSCGGVLSGGGDGPLTKQITAQENLGNGMWRLTIQVTSPRSGTVRVRDCAFRDVNNNGQYDDGTDVLLAGVEIDRTIVANQPFTFTVTVTAQAGQRICDRVAVSGRTGGLLGTDFTDKSNIACVTLGTPPPPVIPEVPLAIVLPLVAAALFGGAVLINRRRESGITAAA